MQSGSLCQCKRLIHKRKRLWRDMQRYTQFTLHFNNRMSCSCGSFSLPLTVTTVFSSLKLELVHGRMENDSHGSSMDFRFKREAEVVITEIIFMLQPWM